MSEAGEAEVVVVGGGHNGLICAAYLARLGIETILIEARPFVGGCASTVDDVGFVEIESDKGHDSFLLDIPDFLNALKNFLDKSYLEN